MLMIIHREFCHLSLNREPLSSTLVSSRIPGPEIGHVDITFTNPKLRSSTRIFRPHSGSSASVPKGLQVDRIRHPSRQVKLERGLKRHFWDLSHQGSLPAQSGLARAGLPSTKGGSRIGGDENRNWGPAGDVGGALAPFPEADESAVEGKTGCWLPVRPGEGVCFGAGGSTGWFVPARLALRRLLRDVAPLVAAAFP
jgi:hypothetical protein